MNYKEAIRNVTEGIEELLRMKQAENYNQYVRADNVDKWLEGQRVEYRALKNLYKKELEQQLQKEDMEPAERQDIEKEYSELISGMASSYTEVFR